METENPRQALALRADIHELCERRRLALEKLRQGVELILEGEALYADACPGLGYSPKGLPSPFHPGSYRGGHIDKFVKEMTTRIDQDMWAALLKSTNLWSLMDQKERARFEQQLRTEPPEVTPEALQATFERLMGESQMIFRRGLVEAFQELSREYRSHDGFKIGDRLVLEYTVTWDKLFGNFSSILAHRAEDKLRDVDRVMHVLDGKKEPDYQQGLCAAFREALRSWRETQKTEFETPYWRVRFFKNGNVHLWVLRDDLRAKANRMIAEHFGEVLGDNTQTKGTMSGKKARHADDLGFFPTPAPIIERMMNLIDGQQGMVVLEPSAGTGELAKRCFRWAAAVDCVELHPGRARELGEMAMFRSVHQGDFLELPAVEVYDRIVMNPPFAHRADILHVSHAWKWLKPGGRLVSVMSQGAVWGADAQATAFRTFVNLHGGFIEPLPAESFKDTGTSVSTVLVTLPKPVRR